MALLIALSVPAQTPPAPDLSGVAPPVRAAIEEEIGNLVSLSGITQDPVLLRDGWLSLGDTLFAHDFNAEALVAYEAAASLGGEDAGIAYRRGVIALSGGQTEQAARAFDRAIAASDGALQAAARVRRGRIELERGDWEAAEADFRAALAIDANSPAALAGAGQSALAGGRPEVAVQQLEAALRLDPGATRLYQPLGLAYRGLGDVDRARAALSQVGEGEPGFPDPVLAEIQLKSRSPQFWLQNGLAQADRGDLTGAAFMIGRATELAPGDLDILASYGRVLAHLGDYEMAEQAFERVVAGEGAGWEDWLYLGRVHQGLGDLAAARGDYETALRENATAESPREALARIDLHEGRGAESAARFAQLAAEAGSPIERARYGYWQAVALLSQDDCSTAASAVTDAMAAGQPVDPDLLQLAARLRATCDDTLGDSLETTVGWAEAVYQQQPGLTSAETLAMSYAAQGRWRDAEDLQAQAIFEALKTRQLETRPALQRNMERYRAREGAPAPFAEDDPIFRLETVPAG